MFRRIRRKLWLIRYHSATRPRTPWTVARDAALPIALACAVPATFFSEATTIRPTPVASAAGRYTIDPQGVPIAAIGDWTLGWSDLAPVGEWSLEIRDTRRGWPLASRRGHERPSLTINDFTRVDPERDVRLESESPLRLAIETALEREGRNDLLEPWRGGDANAPGRARRSWLGTLINVMMWWVILTFAAWAALAVLQLVFRARSRKHGDRAAERLASGRCGHCNYDLRGLEFHDRCPECGTLME